MYEVVHWINQVTSILIEDNLNLQISQLNTYFTVSILSWFWSEYGDSTAN